MKLNRLIEILLILLNRQTVTAKELAAHFNVSIRTIYRDMDELSLSGIPIVMNKGYKGGISLLDNFTISRIYLDEEERNNIIFALQAFSLAKRPDTSSALNKISSLFRSGENDWVAIDYSPWNLPNNHFTEYFNIIRHSILNRHALEFIYINVNNEKAGRKVYPLQLQFQENAWYLQAYDAHKQDYRKFKLNRIRHLAQTKEPFDALPVPPIHEAPANPPGEMVTLELAVSKNALPKLYDHFCDDEIVKNTNGSYNVKVTFAKENFPRIAYLSSMLLSFGSDVKIIRPDFMQEKVLEIARNIVKLYE